MEDMQKQKVGAGILTISIIHLVICGFGLLGTIASFAMKDTINDMIKGQGVPEITTSALIIGIVFTVMLAVAVILILMKKEIGVYMYFIVEVANIVYAVVINGFKLIQLTSFILPVLMGIFIWQKREVFGLGAKEENVTL
jgi:uncharacterized membrane protein (UPF0136 family)